MDQDFMKRGDRERPFSPAPEQPLLRWIAFVLVLLALAYAGYRVWESLSDQGLPAKTKQATPTSAQPSPQPQTSAQPQPAAPATPAPGTRIVTKCVVNGKTIYSDDACPQGAAGAQVVTKADHNLMTGLSPSQMAAADRIQPAAPSLSTIAPSANATPDKRSECVFIDAEIKRLDALARQPLNGHTQDEITRIRKELRDRQFRIHC